MRIDASKAWVLADEDGSNSTGQLFENKIQTLRTELFYAHQHFEHALKSNFNIALLADPGLTSGGFASTSADEKGKKLVRGA